VSEIGHWDFVVYPGLVGDVTRILERVQQGDPEAAEELLPLVYEELRKLAEHKMAHQAAGHTLQPTALVHEALGNFAAINPRKAELVKLRYSTGMTFEETASVLGIAVPTAKEWWAYARAWLAVEMRRSIRGGGPLSRNHSIEVEQEGTELRERRAVSGVRA